MMTRDDKKNVKLIKIVQKRSNMISKVSNQLVKFYSHVREFPKLEEDENYLEQDENREKLDCGSLKMFNTKNSVSRDQLSFS